MDVIWSKEERDHLACYQNSVQKHALLIADGMGVH